MIEAKLIPNLAWSKNSGCRLISKASSVTNNDIVKPMEAS